MKFIRTTVKKPARDRYVPETPFWKNKTREQVKRFVNSVLDDSVDWASIKRKGDFNYA